MKDAAEPPACCQRPWLTAIPPCWRRTLRLAGVFVLSVACVQGIQPLAAPPRPGPLQNSQVGQIDFQSFSPFLQTHCADCHRGENREGDLDLFALPRDLSEPAALAKWVRVYDRVAAGEMPPRESVQPAARQRQTFVHDLGESLTAAHRAQKGTVLRRLNRREYQNTLNDLFGTHLDLAGFLPEDGRAGEFDNVGSALDISMVQLRRYLESVDAVLDAAIARTAAPPVRNVVRASYAQTRGAEQFLGKVWLQRDDGAVVFFKEFGYPTGMLREATVQTDGWYDIRVTGYAYQADRPITFAVGATTFAPGAEKPTFGYFEMPPGQPTTIQLRAWIKSRYMIEVTPYGISDRNNEIRQQGVQGYKGPGLAIQQIEVEGPIMEEFPGRGHRLIFDGLTRQEIPPRNPSERSRPWYVPRYEIVSSQPEADVLPVLRRVATAAFRRPVSTEQVSAYRALFSDELKKGASFEESLRSAIGAIFCSPDFLYLRETPGLLDDHALAARLSYFLTRTLPDEELLAAARTGKLVSDRTTLLAQTERLLEHPLHARFVEDFTDAWLNLRDINFTTPDRGLFPEFDPFLQSSMIAETRAFLDELLRRNLSVRNIVKCEFAMLNNRLAEHYGIPGVTGPEIRRVTLPAGSPRGGFLSQGSVLKVSANGTNTSPVVRGVWVLERILGEVPPPPPKGVPGVEPDVRGATTLRELLDKHRALQSCRSCHQMIDPPGFALESFDPIGGWRDRFRSLGEGDRVDVEVNGLRVRYRLGPPVDASGSLADGRQFSGFQEFRDLLAKDEAVLAKAMTMKLLTFATGRELGFSDRPEIERIVQQSARSGYGLRDMLQLVVSSDIFRSK